MHQTPDQYLMNIQRVYRMSAAHLSRLSNLPGGPSQEFLFLDDLLWGVRYRQGDYQIKWAIGTSELIVIQGQVELDRISLITDASRRAA